MFSDIGSSFLSMIQQDIPKEILLNTDTAASQKTAFTDHLNKQLEKVDSHDASPSLQGISGVLEADQNSKETISSLFEKLDQEDGTGFVFALKEILLKLSKGDLKNLTINAGGLEALKKMLLKAGFKEADVDEVFTGLLEKTKNGKLSLADLADNLSALSNKEKEKNQSENFLEISAIPFLESILNSLGINKEEIGNIMAEADKGEKGISLDVIIEKLKVLQKNSFYTQKTFETAESDRNYQHLLKQLGIEKAENKLSPLSLDEFVDALESLRKKLSKETIASDGSGIAGEKNPETETQKPVDLFTALFKGLEQLKQKGESTGFGFSFDQIKNQFENKLLLPEDKNTTTGNPLFSVNKDVLQGSDTKQKEVNKNFEVFLNQKKNTDIDPGGLQKEIRGALRQLKPENSKIIDPSPVSGIDAKTDVQTGLQTLKSKPSLNELPAYVTQQVSKSLVRAINQGENILRIQLKPPELGRLMMTIDNTGNNMKITIMTENQAAKEILVSNINDIRTALSNSGVNLERFDVDMNSNFQQSMADARNQAGNPGQRQQNRGRLSSDPVTGVSMDDPAGLLDVLNPDGSLHYVA
jgi:flagellar hook-length control protein FliK